MLPFALLAQAEEIQPSETKAPAFLFDYGLAMHGTPKYTSEDVHLDYANPNAPKGGTLKQASVGTFDTLNPFSIKGKAADGLDGLFYTRLMGRVWDEPFTLYPLIAKKADVPADRSSVTFHLDDRAVFHDGTPITADDVLFSYQTLMESGRPNQRRIYKLATPEKMDDHTVKFTFGEGYDQETFMIFAIMPVLSKSWWQDRDFEATLLTPPPSTGPYKVASVDPGRKIVFERIKDHWAKDLLVNKGHHNFDQIVFEYYRDSDVALEAFKSGDLNFRREWDASAWNNNYKDIENNPDIWLEELEHGRPDRVRAFIFNTRRPPFDDINVRKALNLLFDFDWVNKSLYYGEYKQIDSFYPNTDLGAPKPKEETVDLRVRMREADKLLKEAGWIVKDGKRIHNDTGKPFTFEILLDDPNNEKLALALKQNLARMGIQPQIRSLDTAAFRGRLNEYDFDMVLYYWLSSLSPGTEQYLYWSCEAANQPARWNFAGICDPEIDELSKQIARAKTREELLAATQTLDQKLLDGQYMIPLYYNPKDFVAYRGGIEHPDVTPLYGLVVETWWKRP